MRRFLLCLWAVSSLSATLLTCGCQHNRCCCCCSKCHTQAAAALAAPFAVSSRPAPAVSAPAQSNVAGLPAVSTPVPVVHTTAKLNPADPERNQGSPPSLADPSQDAPTPAGERFGHDPNYRWLVGALDYSRIQGAWLLRYVPFEEDDRYGGCVTLVGFVPPRSLKSGQSVRVEGELIDPNSRQLRPAFQVRNFRVAGL